MSRTYLAECLKDGHLTRWPDNAMPIQVYIAPFVWYEKKKQQESLIYRQMVLDALNAWQRATDNHVRFSVVSQLNQSQINFKWRRVDRRSLGHCTYETDNLFRLFSAEIQIGISDGLLHARYQDAGEVQHTILHEIGHALGLVGHSDGAGDIMYVPHQYGVHALSPRDIETIRWLYRLPVGFDYRAIGKKYKLPPGFTLDDVIHRIEARIQGVPVEDPAPDETTPHPAPEGEANAASPPAFSTGAPAAHRTRSLEEQHAILSEMGRFYIRTQNIKPRPEQTLHRQPLSKLPPQD